MYSLLVVMNSLHVDFAVNKLLFYWTTRYTILVSCSKPSRNQFTQFNVNRFTFGKWNTLLINNVLFVMHICLMCVLSDRSEYSLLVYRVAQKVSHYHESSIKARFFLYKLRLQNEHKNMISLY